MGVLCNKRADYEPNLKIVFVIPQQIHVTHYTMMKSLMTIIISLVSELNLTMEHVNLV